MRSLAQRVEKGGVLCCAGIDRAAQPFFVVLLRRSFPARPVVVVTESLKTQESFQQDIETWCQLRSRTPGTQDRQAHRTGRFPAPALAGSSLDSRPLFYPAWETLPHEAGLPHVDVISDRLETLVALSAHSFFSAPAPGGARQNRGLSPLVLSTVTALLQPTFAPAALQSRMRILNRGDRIAPLDLAEWLDDHSYEREAQVTQKGEFATRGGILDVFPLTSPWPVRLEFFGNELESLRWFDPLTQISREEITGITLPPGGELGILKRVSGARDQAPDAAHQRSGGKYQPSGSASPDTPHLTSPLGTLLDYLPADALFILTEPERLASVADEYRRQVPPGNPFFLPWGKLLKHMSDRGMTRIELTENGVAQFVSLEAYRPLSDRTPDLQIAEAQRREFFNQIHRWLRRDFAVHVFCNNEGERQRFEEIWRDLGPEPASSWTTSPDEPGRDARPRVQAERQVGATTLTSAMQEHEQQGSPAEPGPSNPLSRPVGESRIEGRPDSGTRDANSRPENPPLLHPATHLGALGRGFLCEDAKLVVVTDAEIFGRYKVQRPRRLKSAHAQIARSALDIDFTELEEGDLVVHLQHGIGRYLGLKTMPLGTGRHPLSIHGRSEAPRGQVNPPPPGTAAGPDREGSNASGPECLVIEFAPTSPEQPPPKLYVPVSEAHLVSKYVGAGKARPPLNTLGGTRWTKAREQAERAVHDVAAELLSIQAARESQAGHAFAGEGSWQREFESAFIFEETPDQITAIHQTKADMERPKPMDRLICGDVGFGKTEVAIRAAFKAVLDGKQVAVLVPTTVLAQQHFNTFRERMADYPVRIELLSRFRTRGQQQRVARDLATGGVDVVIGTHRLLQNDIGFKDLGLVVIDEEQRFGVMHKEKFKLLRKLVDVLTLSATPIPRTLYLALSGARDMSTIQTPPHDRLPVETIVAPYDERVIRDAIQRELNRGGQVFFLHNRVLTIHTMEQKLRNLVPQARVVVGHGQMHSDELEAVMTRFVNGEADVLLSTTIIESGLDIPNANTIIIDRADRFGLSDLYQLRGRVGRYKHQAYAYLLLPRHAGLLSDARRRISAIKQYSTLGSGFKIAMRDLEIRGAGNLLGAEQSGHITAVGFELYCQLLKQSIGALKGEKVKPRIDVEVRLDFLSTTEEAGSATEPGRSHVESFVGSPIRPSPVSPPTSLATLPHAYVPEPRHRIEVYRKLAQTTDKASLESLAHELRDRFGPPPPPVELLLQIGELKLLAAERGINAIEVKDDKLMLTRQGDYIMMAGKFPRLTKKTSAARLQEIKRFLLAL